MVPWCINVIMVYYIIVESLQWQCCSRGRSLTVLRTKLLSQFLVIGHVREDRHTLWNCLQPAVCWQTHTHHRQHILQPERDRKRKVTTCHMTHWVLLMLVNLHHEKSYCIVASGSLSLLCEHKNRTHFITHTGEKLGKKAPSQFTCLVLLNS